jgi:hypothetical protein
MIGHCSTLATSNESDRSRPPRSRRRLLLRAMPDGTPSRDAGSEDAWSVGNVSGALNGVGSGRSSRSETSPTEDTIAVFRGARRRTDDETADKVSTESLDYFTPALRAVLRDETPTTEASADTAPEDMSREDEADSASLDYFTPALP